MTVICNGELLDRLHFVCGDAADKCPITPQQVRREHWGFDDPDKAEGTEEEKWAVFRRVRDQVGERIKQFAETGE